MATFSNSYVITNRNNIAYSSATGSSAVVPLSPSSTPSGVQGSMWFYQASGSYVCNSTQYSAANPTPATTAPTSFQSNLVTDLQATVDSNGVAHLCVYLHGLGNPFGNSVVDVASLGNFLSAYGEYGGLVIGFDWPSYGSWDSIFYYASSAPPPTATSGTIRDNINGTTAAFLNLMIFLQTLKAQMPLQVTFICHSEGNYMMMLGMQVVDQYIQANPTFSWANIDQVILLAADINQAALYAPNSDDSSVAWGATIASRSDQVTIYYSGNDSVLEESQNDFPGYHDPSQPDRLGYTGPGSGNGVKYGQNTMPPNVIAVDCSNVINATVCAEFQSQGYMPSGLGYSQHSLYMYCPQVLSDITQTINGAAPSSISDREPQSRPDGQGYTMTLVNYPPPPATTTPCSGSSSTTAPRDRALLEALRARAAKRKR